jgi:hypothetical protein
MSLVWIAWRTSASVKENCAEFREDWLEWFPSSWNFPTEDGQRFEQIEGYELRSLRGSNLFRLTLSEVYMREECELPSTAQLTIAEAEKELLNALAAGALGRHRKRQEWQRGRHSSEGMAVSRFIHRGRSGCSKA